MYLVREKNGLRYTVQHSNRLFLFTRGFVKRQEALQAEYLLHNVVVPDVGANLLFIDVGANIGELSYYARSLGLT